MYTEQLICVSTVGIGEGRCRNCGDPVIWAQTASRPGHPSKAMPFNLPRPWPVRTAVNSDTGIGFEWWSREKLHFVTCTSKPTRTKPRQRSHA